MMKLEEMHQEGKTVLVNWHYASDDEDMADAGEEYAEIVEIPFEKLKY
jgi:hypothetical protein